MQGVYHFVMKLSLPDKLSLSRIALAGVFVYTFFLHSFLGGVGCIVVIATSQITDFLDGYIARRRGEVSDFGKWIDPLTDAIFFMTVFVCFWLDSWMPSWAIIMLLSREVIMNCFLRPWLRSRKVFVGARMSGKVKTVVQGIIGHVGLLILLDSMCASPMLQSGKTIMIWLFSGVAILSVGSLLDYAIHVYKTMQGSKVNA